MEKEKKMSKQTVFTLVLAGVLLLTACQSKEAAFECTDDIGCVTIAPDEPIKLGILQSLSGGAVRTGNEQVRSIKLAIVRRDNQLLDHPIELQVEDERCSPEGGAIAALRVVADPQFVGILGTNCSGAAVTAGEIMSEAGMVMVSGANTSPSLTAVGEERGPNWQPGYFRTTYNDAERGRALATFVFEELGVTRVATVNDGDVFTRGLTDVFAQVFTELGGEIALAATVNKGDTDMHPVLTAVATSGAELVFFSLFQPEADFIVQQASEIAGLENVVLVSAGLVLDNFIEAIGADGIGMYFTGPAVLESHADDELRSEYELRYGEPPPGDSYAFGYDAANLLLDAIGRVAILDDDGTLHIGRQALRDELYATTDFEGVISRLTCDEFGDCGSVKFSVYRLDDPAAGVEGLKSNVVFTYISSE